MLRSFRFVAYKTVKWHDAFCSGPYVCIGLDAEHIFLATSLRLAAYTCEARQATRDDWQLVTELFVCALQCSTVLFVDFCSPAAARSYNDDCSQLQFLHSIILSVTVMLQ